MHVRPAIASDPEAGVTLVEIVVALAIVGVMSGVTVLSIGAADRGAGAETEARRLAAHIALAADQALIEGRAIALLWDETGYSLVAEGTDAQTLPDQGARHLLASDLRLTGPSPRGSMAISEGFGPSPISFVVSGRDAGWRVDFDGLAASAARIPGP